MAKFSDVREKIRKGVVIFDDIIHILVAIILIAVAGILLAMATKSFADITPTGLLHVVNDVLLVLIIMELLWTVIRYLRRLPFSLSPFLFIGIISGTRKILTLEAEMAISDKKEIFMLVELGVTALIVFLLVVAYYLYEKALSLNTTRE